MTIPGPQKVQYGAIRRGDVVERVYHHLGARHVSTGTAHHQQIVGAARLWCTAAGAVLAYDTDDQLDDVDLRIIDQEPPP